MESKKKFLKFKNPNKYFFINSMFFLEHTIFLHSKRLQIKIETYWKGACMGKIIIVEDSAEISKIVKLYLSTSGHEVMIAEDGEEGLKLCRDYDFDLGIFDLMLPKLDGYDLIEKVREFSEMPILILSAKIEEYDKVKGFGVGADDYIQKPFNPVELVARVNASLRRWELMKQKSSGSEILIVGELSLDLKHQRVKKGKEEIDLTALEYKILSILMDSPGRIYSKLQICEMIHGDYFETDENGITVHVSHIRDKIGLNEKGESYIKTKRGLGYKIEN